MSLLMKHSVPREESENTGMIFPPVPKLYASHPSFQLKEEGVLPREFLKDFRDFVVFILSKTCFRPVLSSCGGLLGATAITCATSQSGGRSCERNSNVWKLRIVLSLATNKM